MNRGGRPVIHASRWLAVRLERNRIEPRVRRMLARLQRALATDPWSTLRGLTQGRITRRELIMQQREAALLADPTSDGGRWTLGVWAAQRRDIELLALLEKIGDPADRQPTLSEYLATLQAEEVGEPEAGEPEAGEGLEDGAAGVSLCSGTQGDGGGGGEPSQNGGEKIELQKRSE